MTRSQRSWSGIIGRFSPVAGGRIEPAGGEVMTRDGSCAKAVVCDIFVSGHRLRADAEMPVGRARLTLRKERCVLQDPDGAFKPPVELPGAPCL
jgi:hypothetical protein